MGIPCQATLLRLQREVLQNPADRELAELLEELLAYPDVPEDWRDPNFSLPSEPTHSVRIRCGDDDLHFLTTLTIFNAPQSMILEELHIESYFPLDETTERVCTEMAEASE